MFSEGTMNADTDSLSEESVKVIQGRIAHFRDVQWQQIWCIVRLKVDQNKTTAVKVIMRRRIQ